MLKPALQLRLGQQLTMTPQLQQAIRLLQLPVLELQQQIREALETNVMLESEDEARREMANDPGVIAGIFTFELHRLRPFYDGCIAREGAAPAKTE